jgi:hypothetical protein
MAVTLSKNLTLYTCLSNDISEKKLVGAPAIIKNGFVWVSDTQKLYTIIADGSLSEIILNVKVVA